jgi:methylenetetrahydrofolate reductase (NADPH)
MFTDTPYLIELLTPSQASVDLDAALERFQARYTRILKSGSMISIPDNPLGQLRFTALETLTYLELEPAPEQLLVHLNTFHRRADLDELLAGLLEMGVRNLLCVSGDGSSRLPRLEPADLGCRTQSVTSVELLTYIRTRYPAFRLGAAYNPYEPAGHELDKLKRKLAAGAEYLITQPLIAGNGGADFLSPPDCPAPFIPGAWLSDKLGLLAECLGILEDNLPALYNARGNLRQLEQRYPGKPIYLSLLSFKQEWQPLLSRLKCVPDPSL